MKESFRIFRVIKTVSDLPLPVENPEEIDPGIRNLVRALYGIGASPRASCQGELDDRHYSFPWVNCAYEGILNYRVAPLLESFNQLQNIKWMIGKLTLATVLPREEAKNSQELILLQQSADLLANYLFQHGILPFPEKFPFIGYSFKS